MISATNWGLTTGFGLKFRDSAETFEFSGGVSYMSGLLKLTLNLYTCR